MPGPGTTIALSLIGALATVSDAGQVSPPLLKPKAYTGSRMLVSPVKTETVETRKVMQRFGRCIYMRNPVAVDRVLQQTNMIEPKVPDAVSALPMASCLGQTVAASQAALKMQWPLLRGVLTEQTYLRRHNGLPVAPAGVAARSYAPAPEADLKRARALGQFADCVAETDAPTADALLRSEPGTDAERMAARALAPALGACIFEGQQMQFTVPIIRQNVAGRHVAALCRRSAWAILVTLAGTRNAKT